MPDLKKLSLLAALSKFIVPVMAATSPPEVKVKRNLKVLPKTLYNISILNCSWLNY
jgi:hypothetical protein